jgi:OmpA-OmpF porin, OOP family
MSARGARVRASVAAVVLATLAMSQAHAQYYGGVSLEKAAERAQFGFNGGEKPSELIGLAQLTSVPGLASDNQQSLGIKLGYRFNPYFSVEGSFADRSTQLNLFRGEVNSGFVGNHARERVMSLDLVGSLPIREKITLQGRAGFKTDYATTRPFGDSPFQTGFVGNARAQNLAMIGAGVQVNVSKSLGLRFEVERTRNLFTDRLDGNRFDGSRDSVTFGVLWRF